MTEINEILIFFLFKVIVIKDIVNDYSWINNISLNFRYIENIDRYR